MLIGMRNALMAGGGALPYDAEVEYLESTGTQWIDTGLSMRDVTSIDARVLFTVDRWQTIAGGTAYYAKYVGESNLKWLLSYGSSASGGEVAVNTWYDIEARMDENAATLTVDGTQVVTASSGNSSPEKMGLFARERNNAGADGYMYGKIAYARFYSDGTLVRDFIPVRFTNEYGQTEGAMFDRANPTVGMSPDGSARDDGLYRNRGTGVFSWGNDI